MPSPRPAFPRLYPILDQEILKRHGLDLADTAAELYQSGCTLLQYRNKTDSDGDVLHQANRLRKQLPLGTCQLLLNDRVDLALLAGFDGVHVGQTDLAPVDARHHLGPGKIVGLSTHSLDQFQHALSEPVDYIAIGPVFSTLTKADAEPAIGLELLTRVRALTAKPIVAIGGITLRNAAAVIASGADSIAAISALVSPESSVGKNARELLHLLDTVPSRVASL